MTYGARFPSRQQARVYARGLGWFSLALGALELVAARPLARRLGLPGREGLVRAYGLREIANGAALLKAENPQPWLWARVAGDALDVATIAAGGLRRPGAWVGLAAVAGVAWLDWACARRLSQPPLAPVADDSDRSGWPQGAEAARGAAADAAHDLQRLGGSPQRRVDPADRHRPAVAETAD